MPSILKRCALGAVDRVAVGSGVLRLLASRVRGRLTILMYHKVLPDERARAYPLGNLVVPASAFAQQMRYLAKACHVLPVGEALEAVGRAPANGKPLVAVTFDDGYRDNAEFAAPIMDRHGLRGTFFVPTDFLNGKPLWWDRAAVAFRTLGRDALADRLPEATPVNDLESWLGYLKRCPPARRAEQIDLACHGLELNLPADVFGPMSIDQLRQLDARGHEIAGHSVTHPILPQLDDESLRHELVDSRRQLEDWLGHAVTGMSYPNGDHDDRVVAAAREAGYTWACNTRRGPCPPDADPLRLNRSMISPDSAWHLAGFRAETFGLHDALRRLAPKGRAR